MTRDELLKALKDKKDGIASDGEDDPEKAHREADLLLLLYINDSEIRQTFEEITRWYD